MACASVPKQFQSTSPQGRRPLKVYHASISYQFQSTSPQGRRHLPVVFGDYIKHFNPRLRKGDDPAGSPSGLNKEISIHVSARETTGSVNDGASLYDISIHVSARETTLASARCVAKIKKFQSTSPQGRRRLTYSMYSASVAFQSTSPQGRRQRLE